MPTYQFSHDGKYLAYSKETNLYLYNLSSSVHVQVSKSFSSAIAFSYDCNWLAFADESGGIHVFDIRSGNVFVSFSNVSGKNDLICGMIFLFEKQTNILISLDQNSNIYVSNIDKKILKLHYHDKSTFSSLDPKNSNPKITSIEKYSSPETEASSEASELIYLIFDTYFILFNYISGNTSRKINNIPCILDSNLVDSSAFGNNLLVKVDKSTVIKFRNKGKYSKLLTNSYDLVYKKRFNFNVAKILSVFDGYNLILENDGSTLHFLKSDKEIIKIKFQNTSKRRKHQPKIIYFDLLSNNKLIIVYEDEETSKLKSAFNYKVYSKNIDEILSNVSRNICWLDASQGQVSGSDSDGLGSLEQSQSGSLVTGKIKSDKNYDYDEISGYKRKFSELSVSDTKNSKDKTIGDTLQERLENDEMVTENTSADDNLSSEAKKPATSGSLNIHDKSLTIAQYLQSQDYNAVKNIVIESCDNEEIIYETSKNLGRSYIHLMVKILSQFIKDNQNSYTLSNTSLEWVKTILKMHPNYILTSKTNSYKSLLKIHELANEKKKYGDMLLRLNGKINYFLQDPSEKSSAFKFSSIQKMSESLHSSSIQPQFIYEADNDTSETESDTENSNFEDEDPDNQSDLEEEEEEENSHLPPNNFEDPELDAEMEDEDSEDPEFMEEDSSDEINNNKRRKTYDLSPTAEKSKNRRKKSKHTFDGVESPSSDEEEDMIRVTA